MKLTPMQTSNLSEGDDIHEDIEAEMIYFHNVNGIKKEQNWYQILTTLKELNVGQTEMGTDNKKNVHTQSNNNCRKRNTSG
jgi:hypothetical protein